MDESIPSVITSFQIIGLFIILLTFCIFETHFFEGHKMIRQDSIIAGAGVILLTLWAIIFVNILLSNPSKQSSDWHKRLEPDNYSTKSVSSDNSHVLVLATTLMAPDVWLLIYVYCL